MASELKANNVFFSFKDTYVEKNASKVDISLCTSSSSLDKPRVERIINNHLKKTIPPPWGNSTADNWRNRCENYVHIHSSKVSPLRILSAL